MRSFYRATFATFFAAALVQAAPVKEAPAPNRGSRPATFAEIPPLDMAYTAPEIRAVTVTMLGSSKETPAIRQDMAVAQRVSSELIQRGYNCLTGCGNSGILGAVTAGTIEGTNAALQKGLRPGENLAVVASPPWGDENLVDSRAVGVSESEAARIEKFQKLSDHFVIFPGGPATLQEASALIAANHYRGSSPAKRILLVGSEYFKGLREQYDRLYAAGLLKTPPSELFLTADSAEEILSHFPSAQ